MGKEYVYDYQHYYIKEDYNFKIITKAEYKKETGDSDSLINKTKNCAEPFQRNDFFFLKSPFKLEKHYMIERLELLNIKDFFDKIGFLSYIKKVNKTYYIEFTDPYIIEFLEKRKIINYINIINDLKISFNETNKIKIYKKLKLPIEKKIKIKPNGYIPIDWALSNIIKYFWDLGIETLSSDQGNFNNYGYIKFKNIKKIIKLFGNENIIFLENNKEKYDKLDEYDRLNKLYPNKLKIFPDNLMIFEYEMIDWMTNKLGLEKPIYYKSHIGGKMVYKLIQLFNYK
jgi:hypothetical protein